jgi:hypothetical protein
MIVPLAIRRRDHAPHHPGHATTPRKHLERLQEITEQLERTGTLSATTVTELRQILDMLSSTADGVDARTAAGLAYAAEIFGTIHFSRMVRALEHAAEVLPAVARDLRRYGGDH